MLSSCCSFFVSLTAGDEEQSAWLFYTTAFPSTRIDTPAHAEYKAEIREWVQKKRDRIDFYDEEDDEVHDFLRDPENYPAYPLWQALAKDKTKQNSLYKSLALRASSVRLHWYLHIGLQRLGRLPHRNQADFKPTRLFADYYADRFREMYPKREKDQTMMRIVFRACPRPALPHLTRNSAPMVSPYPDSAAARFSRELYGRLSGPLAPRPPPAGRSHPAPRLPPHLSGLVASRGRLAFAARSPIGAPWGLDSRPLRLLPAVFLVGIEHHRYFALAWPLIILLLALVPQVIVQWIPPRTASTPKM